MACAGLYIFNQFKEFSSQGTGGISQFYWNIEMVSVRNFKTVGKNSPRRRCMVVALALNSFVSEQQDSIGGHPTDGK